MSVLASDAFTRANETPLASPWGSWNVAQDRAFNLTSNAATRSLGEDCREWYDGSISWPNDQYSQAALTVTGTTGGGVGPGLSLRSATGALTCYRFVIDHGASGNWEIGVFNAGFSSLATGTLSWTDGDTFKMLVVGTSITVQKNGAAAFATTSDGAIASGKPGLAYSDAVTSLSADNWEGGDTGGGAFNISANYGTDPIIQMWDWAGLY